MAFNEKIWTQVLTDGIILIDESFGLQDVAMKLISGVGSFSGTLRVGTYASMPIPLEINDSVTITAELGISQLTIDCSGGGVIYLVGTRR